MKYVKRKRYSRKNKRYTKRYSRINKNVMSLYKRPVYIKRSHLFTTINLSGDYSNAWSFALNDLTNYTDFTNLYDFYQLKGVKIRFLASSNVNLSTAGATYDIPKMAYAWDYNDITAPSTQEDMLQNDNVKVVSILTNPKTYGTPKVQETVWISAIASGYAQGRKNMYLNTANANIPHFGLKTYIQCNATGTVLYNIKMFVTYYLKFKDAK